MTTTTANPNEPKLAEILHPDSDSSGNQVKNDDDKSETETATFPEGFGNDWKCFPMFIILLFLEGNFCHLYKNVVKWPMHTKTNNIE